VAAAASATVRRNKAKEARRADKIDRRVQRAGEVAGGPGKGEIGVEPDLTPAWEAILALASLRSAKASLVLDIARVPQTQLEERRLLLDRPRHRGLLQFKRGSR
jgi:hypothetical protein